MMQIMLLYTLQYECTESIDQDKVDQFNSAKSSGDISDFIATKNQKITLTIPCGVTELSSQVQKYSKKAQIQEILIPDTVTTIYSLVSVINNNIKYGNFQDCTNLEYVDLSKNLKKITKKMFYNCEKIHSVQLYDKITEIEEYAFYQCTSLKYIDIPSSVYSLGKGVFQNCEELVRATLSSKITGLKEYTFAYCTKLQSVYLPYQLEIIEQSVFENCTSLQQIDLPQSVQSIGIKTFKNCTNLQQITIPNKVKAIKSNLFYNCSSLSQVNLPEQLEEIDSNAFENTSIQQINLPQNLKKIGNTAFQNCKQLQQIRIPYGVTNIGMAAFSDCENLKFVSLPETLTTLKQNAFYSCKNLQQINIPSGLTSISNYAFSSCEKLKQIILPESITTIQVGAFSRCYSLSCIQKYGDQPQIGQEAFYETQFDGISSFSQRCQEEYYINCSDTTDQYIIYVNNEQMCYNPMFVQYYIIKDQVKYYQEYCQEPYIYYTNSRYPQQCVENCIMQYPYINSKNDKQCLSKCNQYEVARYQNNKYICQAECEENEFQDEIQGQYVCVSQCPENRKYIMDYTYCISSCYYDTNGYSKYIEYNSLKCTNRCKNGEKVYQVQSDKYQCVRNCNSIEGYTFVNQELICASDCGQNSNNQSYVWYYEGPEKLCQNVTNCSEIDRTQTITVLENNQCQVDSCKFNNYYYYEVFSENATNCMKYCLNVLYYYYFNNNSYKVCTQYTKCSQVPQYNILSEDYSDVCVQNCGKIYLYTKGDFSRCTYNCYYFDQYTVEQLKKCVNNCSYIDYIIAYYNSYNCVEKCNSDYYEAYDQVNNVCSDSCTYYQSEDEQYICIQTDQCPKYKQLKRQNYRNRGFCIDQCNSNLLYVYNKTDILCLESYSCKDVTNQDNIKLQYLDELQHQCVQNCKYFYYYNETSQNTICTEQENCIFKHLPQSQYEITLDQETQYCIKFDQCKYRNIKYTQNTYICVKDLQQCNGQLNKDLQKIDFYDENLNLCVEQCQDRWVKDYNNQKKCTDEKCKNIYQEKTYEEKTYYLNTSTNECTSNCYYQYYYFDNSIQDYICTQENSCINAYVGYYLFKYINNYNECVYQCSYRYYQYNQEKYYCTQSTDCYQIQDEQGRNLQYYNKENNQCIYACQEGEIIDNNYYGKMCTDHCQSYQSFDLTTKACSNADCQYQYYINIDMYNSSCVYISDSKSCSDFAKYPPYQNYIAKESQSNQCTTCQQQGKEIVYQDNQQVCDYSKQQSSDNQTTSIIALVLSICSLIIIIILIVVLVLVSKIFKNTKEEDDDNNSYNPQQFYQFMNVKRNINGNSNSNGNMQKQNYIHNSSQQYGREMNVI